MEGVQPSSDYAEEPACLREWQRIAQALHDTLAQMLFTIGLEAEWCINHVPLDGEARQRLQAIRHLAARSQNHSEC